MEKTIIAIDPGASGGIAVYVNHKIQTVKMPKKVTEMRDYLEYLQDTHENLILFIEKVQAFSSDDDAPGKKFAINKMLANYQQLLTVIELQKITYVEVYPVSWQTSLGLKLSKEESKNETKTERKNRYKETAQKMFPEIKVTLSNSDALCIVQFALWKFANDPYWIRERIKGSEERNLFYEKYIK